MLNVYCIPGMGVDGRLFKNLKLNNCLIHHIKWETPFKNESLASYTFRLANQIDASQPFALIGVSFGGMCCMEIAKKFKPVKAFIVSSSKTRSEVPQKIKMWKRIPMYKFISDTTYKKAAFLLKKQFGVTNEDQAKKFREMLDTSPKNYFKGAVHCIMQWNNNECPESIVHIHGTADQVLPYNLIRNCDYSIKNGTHFMVINKADEISMIINKELEKSI